MEVKSVLLGKRFAQDSAVVLILKADSDNVLNPMDTIEEMFDDSPEEEIYTIIKVPEADN